MRQLRFALGDNIYLNRKSASLLSDSVHEGTHALDFLDDVPYEQWEKRAYMAERQFQKASGRRVDFESIDDMDRFIQGNYEGQRVDIEIED